MLKRSKNWRSNEIFRALDLPTEVDPAKAEAALKEGVLTIVLPKRAMATSSSAKSKAE
jgi:HSP20 family molecular chaperone IbpA